VIAVKNNRAVEVSILQKPNNPRKNNQNAQKQLQLKKKKLDDGVARK